MLSQGRITVVTKPTQEPITTAEARAQCRIDHTDEDGLLEMLIAVARQEVELIARRSLITQTLKLTIDVWPGRTIRLPRPPVQSVTSVVCIDEDGGTNTVSSADYLVDTVNERLVLKRGASWPSVTLRESGAIAVTYVAGYGTSADVPEMYAQAVKLLVGSMFEHRESVILGQGITLIDTKVVERFLKLNRAGWM